MLVSSAVIAAQSWPRCGELEQASPRSATRSAGSALSARTSAGLRVLGSLDPASCATAASGRQPAHEHPGVSPVPMTATRWRGAFQRAMFKGASTAIGALLRSATAACTAALAVAWPHGATPGLPSFDGCTKSDARQPATARIPGRPRGASARARGRAETTTATSAAHGARNALIA
jgi:hypothetical protein